MVTRKKTTTRKRKPIRIKPKNRGKFTAWAKARGMTVAAAAAMVKRNPGRYSAAVRKMANFASNSRKWKK
jgi:hypothetical protein